MIANCSVMANKARQQPAGVLQRHRGLEQFAQFSSGQPMDALAGLNSSLHGLVPGMSSMSGGLGSLVSTPASPSRMLPNTQSSFPVFINQLQHPVSASPVRNA